MRLPDRRARAATVLVFFLTGAVFAAWSTRLPAIKEQLHLSNGALALAILGLEAGAIAGLPAGGALVARTGSRAGLRIMAVARILSAITALPAFFVPDVPALFVTWGAATVVLTIVAVVLLMSRSRERVAS
jgi:MFS family permease